VVAFEKDLAAAADAHQLMAEFSETRGRISGAGEGEDGERKDGALQNAAGDRVGFKFHYLLISRISAAKAAFSFDF
jgi:hypothetical protein